MSEKKPPVDTPQDVPVAEDAITEYVSGNYFTERIAYIRKMDMDDLELFNRVEEHLKKRPEDLAALRETIRIFNLTKEERDIEIAALNMPEPNDEWIDDYGDSEGVASGWNHSDFEQDTPQFTDEQKTAQAKEVLLEHADGLRKIAQTMIDFFTETRLEEVASLGEGEYYSSFLPPVMEKFKEMITLLDSIDSDSHSNETPLSEFGHDFQICSSFFAMMFDMVITDLEEAGEITSDEKDHLLNLASNEAMPLLKNIGQKMDVINGLQPMY